jgi:hypothetical protein
VGLATMSHDDRTDKSYGFPFYRRARAGAKWVVRGAWHTDIAGTTMVSSQWRVRTIGKMCGIMQAQAGVLAVVLDEAIALSKCGLFAGETGACSGSSPWTARWVVAHSKR